MFDQHCMRQFRLDDDGHARSILACHPWRKMRQSAIGLPDSQIRLAPVIVHPDDGYPFTAARVKRIADDHIIAVMMGSVLLVRLALAKATLDRPSDTR